MKESQKCILKKQKILNLRIYFDNVNQSDNHK